MMKYNPKTIHAFAEALKKAQEAANEVKDGDDNGTCNLDCVVIDFKGWRQNKIEELAKLSGISFSNKLTSGFWKGCCFVNFNVEGQANKRSRMVEAAKKSLEKNGYDASVYYQMD